MFKPWKLVKLLYFTISFLFFLQGLKLVHFIPVEPVARLLGLNTDPLAIFLTVFYAIFFICLMAVIVKILYSVGMSRETKWIDQNKIFAQGLIAFFTVWVTLFSYSLMAVCGIVPKILVPDQFLNFYLAWYFLIAAPFISIFSGKKVKKIHN